MGEGSTLFIGNNRKHIPLCAKAHMSLDVIRGVSVSVTMVESVPCVSILQTGDWAGFQLS